MEPVGLSTEVGTQSRYDLVGKTLKSHFKGKNIRLPTLQVVEYVFSRAI